MPCLRPQAGSSRILAVGKPSVAPALVAVDHLAGDEPGRARAARPPPPPCRRPSACAHRAGGDRPALVFQRRHDVDGKAELARPARRDSAGEPPRSLPKWKSKPIAAPPMPRRPTRICSMKSSAAVPASPASKVMTMAPSSPVGGEQAQLVALARELEQRLLRPEEAARMRREGQGRRLAAERARRARSAASITARWPRCTPSKLPIATTAPASGPASMCAACAARDVERRQRLSLCGAVSLVACGACRQARCWRHYG